MSGFKDRRDAGQQLGEHLRTLRDWPDTLVLGLPRGGVPVAAEVARSISAPLDVFLVRKLGVPFHPEVAMGAIASGGVEWLNQALLEQIRLTPQEIDRVRQQELLELMRREAVYRAGRERLSLKDKTVLLVDDGLATGATMHAALQAVSTQGAEEVIVAVPVASTDTCQELRTMADEVICLQTPPEFRAVGQFYQSFPQTSDAEVMDALKDAAHA